MIPVISEADLIQASTMHGLVNLLNDKLAQGYQPYGEVKTDKNGMLSLIVVKPSGNMKEVK